MIACDRHHQRALHPLQDRAAHCRRYDCSDNRCRNQWRIRRGAQIRISQSRNGSQTRRGCAADIRRRLHITIAIFPEPPVRISKGQSAKRDVMNRRVRRTFQQNQFRKVRHGHSRFLSNPHQLPANKKLRPAFASKNHSPGLSKASRAFSM